MVPLAGYAYSLGAHSDASVYMKLKGQDYMSMLELEIRYATLVRAARDKVYGGIATADGLDGWFIDGAEVDARPGGHIRFRWRQWGADRLSCEDGGPVPEALRPAS